ncbi:MAG: Fpg/Nei family DNA glycosylase [Bacteroidales bacterium]
MPELPDVEIFRQYAEKNALNRHIQKVTVDEPKIAESDEEEINQALKNQKLIRAERLGKYLLLPSTAEQILVMHFGMTGWLDYQNKEKHRHTRASILFANGYALHFINPRKLGRISLTDDLNAFKKEKKIGEDALALHLEEFQYLIRKKKGTLKSFLMNQGILAGIGNIYSDEILFQAAVDPKRQTSDLEDYQQVYLFQSMKEVLHKAIELNADPENMPSSFLLPRRKEGEKCPACGGDIRKNKVSGRNFYFCPNCQT